MVCFGIQEAPQIRVMTMTQINRSTFPSLISRMAKTGLIVYGSQPRTLKITDKGRSRAPADHEFVTSNAEHHESIRNKLKGKARQIFDLLADGKAHHKDDIMVAVNCTNPKTFAPLMSRELKKHGYIEYPSNGMVQLSNVCFPFPRDA